MTTAKEEKKRGNSTRPTAKRRGSTGRRLAIAVLECLVLLLVTGGVLLLLSRTQAQPQTRVYIADVPDPGTGTLVLPASSIFAGSDGAPCMYRVEKERGRSILRAVAVQTEPYDGERVTVQGLTDFSSPYVMLAEDPLQDGMEVSPVR